MELPRGELVRYDPGACAVHEQLITINGDRSNAQAQFDPNTTNVYTNYPIRFQNADTVPRSVVVTNGDQETARLREEKRLGRIGKPSGKKLDGKLALRATENLAVRSNGKGGRWCCAKCATDLGPASENYKLGCIRNDLPIKASNPIVGDPARFIDPVPQFRQFCCPGCGLAIENEIAIAEDPVLRDVELQ